MKCIKKLIKFSICIYLILLTVSVYADETIKSLAGVYFETEEVQENDNEPSPEASNNDYKSGKDNVLIEDASPVCNDCGMIEEDDNNEPSPEPSNMKMKKACCVLKIQKADCEANTEEECNEKNIESTTCRWKYKRCQNIFALQCDDESKNLREKDGINCVWNDVIYVETSDLNTELKLPPWCNDLEQRIIYCGHAEKERCQAYLEQVYQAMESAKNNGDSCLDLKIVSNGCNIFNDANRVAFEVRELCQILKQRFPDTDYNVTVEGNTCLGLFNSQTGAVIHDVQTTMSVCISSKKDPQINLNLCSSYQGKDCHKLRENNTIPCMSKSLSSVEELGKLYCCKNSNTNNGLPDYIWQEEKCQELPEGSSQPAF